MTGRKLAQAAAIAAMIVGAGTGLFTGCGGGGGGKQVTESDFCAQKADAECQVTSICLTDASLCKMQRQTLCTMFATNAKASGKRVFVPGNVADCINKTKDAFKKTSPITPSDMATVDEACNYVFQGKGVVNVDMCDVKFDCANKVICDKGFCATQKNVTSGCGNPGDVCPSDQYCAQNMSSVYVCMPKGMSGTACDGTKPCVDSLRCAGGSCTDRVASGGTCASNADCATSAPFCDPYAGNKCDLGLSFASGSPSCSAFGGTTGAGGTSGGTGGSGGSGGGAGSGAGGRGGSGGSGGGGGLTGLGGLGGLGGVSGLGGLGGLGGTNFDAATD
jgi:hypothetical protein